MLPLSALIILGVVGTFSTLTFLFAIYHTVKTRLEARRLQKVGPDNDVSLPLTETAVSPGTNARSQTPILEAPGSIPPITHPGTPEAENPPLPQELEFKDNISQARTSASSLSPMIRRPKTPDVEHSVRLPRECKTHAEDFIRAETPPPLPPSNRDRLPRIQRDRDSMNEIYEIYSNLPPTPKSAPPRITTFAMADSKWAYFGQKRAREMNMI
ncbi:uncharacterized protein Z519_02529 [Cladophialophora bantiana CBS 173.52]|uniref:Uncharacterized protein n=1 Tax=Cladophialophora bantiana (strain ATCC 10958 / CBS 173.52 / CDC B-1940 / NIH 8579) TaxID=1442370 RepID=A0A0D2GFJ1_CLAB1|nr:uncharacterized protein Z519_02529 [Cladophialophora bantiana CBS 173.52]KIW97137.1 hypothetical protein Z519_02529 [Cladophialophora bantiana CBS 173.52]